MTTVLALAQPLLLATLAHVPQRVALRVTGGFVLLNLAALALLVATVGGPEWAHPTGLLDRTRWQQQGNFAYSRADLLPNNYPEVAAYLQRVGPQAVVVSSNRNAHIPYPNPGGILDDWLRQGACTSQHEVYLVLLDWYWTAETLAERVDAKCPGLSRVELSGAIIYRLPS
ncbi:MAG: hypothetical protein HC876_12090 [Chloroflexaceae bacterium]|nr:hypothetical protein [Chloroflexaceae bacterium]